MLIIDMLSKAIPSDKMIEEKLPFLKAIRIGDRVIGCESHNKGR